MPAPAHRLSSPPAAPARLCAVIAEKPSVARDIAKALGVSRRGAGYLHNERFIVTWAVGHLVALGQPHEINPEWKRWRREALPMLPNEWPLIVYERTADQFETIRKILNSPKVERVVCATDAGREGEAIFRYIYEKAGSSKPIDRLWISSLTPAAISRGFAKLKPGKDYEPLAAAARARDRADWLVGMNLSRAYSLDYSDDRSVLSVGRVQTPTLAILVERELAIRNFVPENYFEVEAVFAAAGGEYKGTYFWLEKGKRATKLPADGEAAARIAERARKGSARIHSVKKEKKRAAPPLLYDLTELQRHANRLYGFSAKQTLEAAQKLYESYKSITYPRTDSRHLSSEIGARLPQIVQAVSPPYADRIAEGTGVEPLGKRYVDDARVTDHHAIIPTGNTAAAMPAEGSDEGKIYDLICRRLLQAWHKDLIRAVTTVITEIDADSENDRYLSSGASIEQEGWKALDVQTARQRKKDEEPLLPGGLQDGQPTAVKDAEALRKTTRPPKRLTEAALLTAMESAGGALDDRELSDAMKERGLGTPATRAAIIETLLKRGYAVRGKKALEATDKGIGLVEIVHPDVKSPAMTGEWEAKLKRIERGEGDFNAFMAGIEEYVRAAVSAGKGAFRAAQKPLADGGSPEAPSLAASAAPPSPRSQAGRGARQAEASFGKAPAEKPARRPESADRLLQVLHEAFGFESFRPHQEDVCREVAAGRDVLLVMPTGAGKSLCYQLPGIARGGATLVVSPLIALMEDQVAKLQGQGLRAERIHSGRNVEQSRQVCRDYLAGVLDFLFIAPERLSVAGFPEMLAKTPPSLIAIDEAHCISQWGHDFRPDYRKLGERLPSLRPAPVIALTATATPRVQEDIVEQLGLQNCLHSIHGFRRGNIAVEIVELTPAQRPPALLKLLDQPGRRPAIVYAPTRKAAEAQARELQSFLPAAAYHAGMTAHARDRVQDDFLTGRKEVIVATIAFGMGIDKPDVRTVAHTGLPGTIEGYYQEIGRAGRDGLPSRAVLMYSWADRHTHQFFLDRDYPPVETLQKLYDALGENPTPRPDLERGFGDGEVLFEKALEKLWIHGGARIDADDNIARGAADWRAPYQRQRAHKPAQLESITRYTGSFNCRMLDLVEHFGDQEDSRKPCGQCDICRPEDCLTRQFRRPDAAEEAALATIVETLRRRGNQSLGKVFRDSFEGSAIDRKAYDRLIGGLARAGILVVSEDSFEKDGRTIEFRRIALTREGRGLEESPGRFVVLDKAAPAPRKKRKAAAKKQDGPQAPPRRPRGRQAAFDIGAPEGGSNEVLIAALRAWRRSEARKFSVPAFRVFPDRTLLALAEQQPANESELLTVKGVGPALARKYGEKILSIVRNAAG